MGKGWRDCGGMESLNSPVILFQKVALLHWVAIMNANFKCEFVDGDIMSKNYCEMPDRRFQIEMANDFNPPGQEYLTNEPLPPRKIPSRCYDLTDSYYNPKVKTIYAYKKSSSNLKANSNSVSPSLDKVKVLSFYNSYSYNKN